MMNMLLIGVFFQMVGVHAPTIDHSTMVEVSTGSFVRGTPTDNPVGRYGDGWYVNEQPSHDVTLRAFSIDRSEVTNDQYALFLTWACGEACFDSRMDIHRSDDGFRAAEGYESHPVNWIEWSHAHWYCRWAGKRLPTESEWEYAAQGVDDRAWPWDRDGGPSCSSSPYSFDGGRCRSEASSVFDTAESGTNDGINGMGGNVAEWVSDWSSSYGNGALSDPTGPATGTMKIVRGGGFLSNRLEMKPRARRDAHPGTRAPDIGFRCAWDDTLTDPQGVIRGALPAATGDLIEPRPREPSPSRAMTVLEGLTGPGALTVVNGTLYVAHSEGVTVLSNDGIQLVQPEPRIVQWLTDGVGVFGVDSDTEVIWRIDDGEARVAYDCPEIVSAHLDEDTLVWTDGERIIMPTEADAMLLFDSGSEINTITIINDTLWWTEKGGPKLMSMTLVDGIPEQRFGPPDIRSPLQLSLGAANDEGVLPMTVGLDVWPYSGLLCRYSTRDTRLNCSSHGPPRAKDQRFYEDRLVWSTQYGVMGLGSRKPYEFLSDPVQPGGFFIEDGQLTFTDRRTGRVLMVELNDEGED